VNARTRTAAPLAALALLALLAVGCGRTQQTTPPAADATDTSAATADAEKGTDTMFGKKKAGLLEVGSAAPAFSVPDHEGNTVQLSDFAGKRVLLWFYPKADTPG
jgi:cytochrome oxidase Cu insertion factor (SCO1/SenC/PrrC family)